MARSASRPGSRDGDPVISAPRQLPDGDRAVLKDGSAEALLADNRMFHVGGHLRIHVPHHREVRRGPKEDASVADDVLDWCALASGFVENGVECVAAPPQA